MEKLDGKAAVVSGGEEKSVTMMHSTYNAPTPTVALPPALANMNNNVLDDAILKKLVDPDIYYAFARCRATGLPMDKADANALAESIREWAQSKVASGIRTGSRRCEDRFTGRSLRRSWRWISRPIG